MQTTAKSLLAFFVALLLSFMLVPVAAFADNQNQDSPSNEDQTVAEGSLDSTSDPQKENSYRYVDGEPLTSEDGAKTDGGDLPISTFSMITNPNGYAVFNWFDTFSRGYCTGKNAYKGIDVSYHNGVIDWKKVKASGVDYAILRCGYGQDEKGQDDTQWINNVKGCIANGIPFGVYIYSYATNASRAAGEADHVLRCLKDAGLDPSKVSYPIYFDMEDASTIGSDYAAMATAFCKKIEAAGYTPGIYANKSWFTTKLTASCFNNWTKWVAEWNASKGLTYSALSDFSSGNGMWQFSDYGTVPGINSKAVDLNYTYMKPRLQNDVKYASVSTSDMVRNATGKSLEPSIAVKLGGKTLTKKTDYTVSYKKKGASSSTTTAPSQAGTYEVVITGVGAYSGTKSVGSMTIHDKPNIDTTMSYRFNSVANDALVLDAAGKIPSKGSNVSIWSSNDGSNQMWYIEPDNEGHYVVKNVANKDYVLDASGASPKNGANISVWTYNKGKNQKWVLVKSGDSYVLKNAANNELVLDASGASPKSGANVTAWSDNGGRNQRWKLTAMNDLSAASVSASGLVRNATGKPLKVESIAVRIGDKTLKEGTDYTVLYDGSATAPTKAGDYKVTVQGKGVYKDAKSVGTMRIINAPSLSSGTKYRLASAANSKFVLDAAGKTPREGSNVSVWTNNGGSNQQWLFVPDGKGFYTIKNAANQGYILDAAGATPHKGSNVSVWTGNDGLNQRWIIESAGGGSYVIRNAANPSFVLDASGKTPKVGANVTVWTSNGGSNQKWKLSAA